MDASDLGVSDHGGAHRAWRNELREHVGNGESHNEDPLISSYLYFSFLHLTAYYNFLAVLDVDATSGRSV